MSFFGLYPVFQRVPLLHASPPAPFGRKFAASLAIFAVAVGSLNLTYSLAYNSWLYKMCEENVGRGTEGGGQRLLRRDQNPSPRLASCSDTSAKYANSCSFALATSEAAHFAIAYPLVESYPNARFILPSHTTSTLKVQALNPRRARPTSVL
jgi:hypothetical protein